MSQRFRMKMVRDKSHPNKHPFELKINRLKATKGGVKSLITENSSKRKAKTRDTAVNSVQLNKLVKNDEIKQYEISTVAVIKKHLFETENDRINDTVEIRNNIPTADIKIEFSDSKFCSNCHEDYEDYCTKCRMLIHILDRNVLSVDSKNAREEIPENILEIRESFGRVGVFTLKVIPKGVKFGPFTGLNTPKHSWKIKEGKFINVQLKRLNWMQYINPARSIFEQNLMLFQYEGNIYYRSICEIQEDEELLVYFGEEYEGILSRSVEIDIVPTLENDTEDVFACTFCCFGFSSKDYLAKHKTICACGRYDSTSSIELTRCPFCKIFLEQREYCEYHMNYCCQKKAIT